MKEIVGKYIDVIIYAICLAFALNWIVIFLGSIINDFWIVIYFNKANEFLFEVIMLFSIVILVMIAYVGKFREGRRIDKNIEIYE